MVASGELLKEEESTTGDEDMLSGNEDA